MTVTEFFADGYKNLKDVLINPSPGVNIFYGENAQGKTNLIEAIWILSGAKSFRGTKERDAVAFDRELARLSLSLKDSEREQKIEAVLTKNPREKKILLNGIKQRSLTSLFGVLKCVVFTPEDLELSKGSPDIRRDFIDLCVSQIKPRYQRTVQKYETVLAQRNALLKNIAVGISDQNDLDVWDDQMAKLGAYISVIKHRYTEKLSVFAGKLYYEISSGKEDLRLEYFSTVYPNLSGRTDWQNELYLEYLNILKKSRADDLRAGFTTVGIHRDDVIVTVNGKIARDFGSQGQNRSAALSMKLAQAYILNEETGEMPVILLDDVLSELDKTRREFIISKLEGMQIFITCCETVKKLRGKRFRVEGGNVGKKAEKG